MSDIGENGFIIAIVTLIGLGLSFAQQVRKDWQLSDSDAQLSKSDDQSTARDTARDESVTRVLNKIVASLQKTDEGSRDNAKYISELVQKLRTPEGKMQLDPEFINNVTKNHDDWDNDVKKYYEHKTIPPEKRDPDPIISDLYDIEGDNLL